MPASRFQGRVLYEADPENATDRQVIASLMVSRSGNSRACMIAGIAVAKNERCECRWKT